jgi:predicted Zn-dependent protease
MHSRRHRVFRNLLSLAFVALIAAACSSGSGRSLLALEDEKTEMRAAIARKIGISALEVKQALDSTPEQQKLYATAVIKRAKDKLGTSRDVAMQKYLQNMAEVIALAAGADDQVYEVVLLSSQRVNAYTPGAGAILLNEGLLQIAQNEAQVAAVIAHEIAHGLMNHPQRQKQIRLASKAGSRMMDGWATPQEHNAIVSFFRLGGNVALNGMIRQQELMADSIGIDIMVRAGYDPREMVNILRTLRFIAPTRDRLTNVVYGNHPLTIDREEAAQKKIDTFYQKFVGVSSSPRFDVLVRPHHIRRSKRLAERGE